MHTREGREHAMEAAGERSLANGDGEANRATGGSVAADTPVRVRARQAHSCDQQERQKNGPFLLNKGVHGPYPQKK